MTFHIKTGLDDPEFHRFRQTYQKFEEEIMRQKNFYLHFIKLKFIFLDDILLSFLSVVRFWGFRKTQKLLNAILEKLDKIEIY